MFLFGLVFYVIRWRQKSKKERNIEKNKRDANYRFQWPEGEDSPAIMGAELEDNGIHEMDAMPTAELEGNGHFVFEVKG
jgi:hypothetical protein